MRTALAAALGLVFLAAAQPAVAQEGTDLSAAKATFEATCSKCHGTDRPLGKTKDREGWQATVARMATKTTIPEADQKAVVEFLTAKDLFGSTCSKCHGTDRPLGKNKDRAGWEETVKRMATKTAIPEAAQKVIIDYLTAVRGK